MHCQALLLNHVFTTCIHIDIVYTYCVHLLFIDINTFQNIFLLLSLDSLPDSLLKM